MAYTTIITPTDGSDELIYDGSEDAQVIGGDGGDSVSGSTGDDRLIGGDGNDAIDGGSGDDWLSGGLGNDAMTGGLGNDLMDGNDGTDTAMFSGDARDYGYSFDKNRWQVTGADGTDTLKNVESAFFSGIGATLLLDRTNNAPLVKDAAATANEDGPAASLDLLTLSDAWDFEGSTLSVAGVDSTGTLGSVSLSGNVATYDGTGAFESLRGDQTGSDGFAFTVTDGSASSTATANVTVQGAWDAPTDVALSNASVDEGAASGTAVGTLQNVVDVDGGDTHSFSLVDNAGGRFAVAGDQLQVADGSLLDFETAASHDVTIRVTDGGGLTYDEAFTISLDDVVEANVINGTDYHDELYGTQGPDIINGFGDWDMLIGLAGDDQLNGGAGDDLLFGQQGNDTLDGGEGSDWAVYQTGSSGGPLTIDLTTGVATDAGWGTTDTIVFASGVSTVEHVKGGNHADTIIGDDRPNALSGEGGFGSSGGDDQIYGAGGDDLLMGDQGNDYLDGGGGSDTARIWGNSAADFSMVRSNGSVIVTDLNASDMGDQGVDELVNVEFIQIGNTTIAVDTIV